MALECTLVHELSTPVAFTCADGTAIPKGSILEITDPMTVAITNGDTDPVIGIAAEEKIANDGKTTIGVYLNGIFKARAGAAGVTVGNGIITDTATGDANELVNADTNSEHIVGTALETATNEQYFFFMLQPINIKVT